MARFVQAISLVSTHKPAHWKLGFYGLYVQQHVHMVPTMDVINFSETRAKLKSVMDRVVRDRTPVIVSRKNGEPVVMVSLADWNAAEETTYLLSQRESAARLQAAVRELDAGKGEERQLIEP